MPPKRTIQSAHENIWTTSVNELMEIFRGALIAIIPWMERAKIKWKEGEAYDDWDNIAESLYNNIVCSSLNGVVSSKYSIARYNFKYENYSDLDFIIVKSDRYKDQLLAFVAYGTKVSPLDSVYAAVLDDSHNCINLVTLDCQNLSFLVTNKSQGENIVVSDITVLL